MGFHCGNTNSKKLSSCSMKYQMIMARALPEEVTQGTLEGDIVPGDITFFRLQSTADNQLKAYVAQGEVLPVATRSFGGVGIFAIPEMGRFYRHILIEKGYPQLPLDIMEKRCLRCLSILEWRILDLISLRGCCIPQRIHLRDGVLQEVR